jgi:DNA mismatch repair ATPase MutL
MGPSSAVAGSGSKPPQQQQRRRYAFVHDPSSAINKEREEHEKRFQYHVEKRNSTAVFAARITTATSTHDENDEEADDDNDDVSVMEQDERKRPASSRNARDLSTIGTTTTAMQHYDHVQQPPRKAPPPSHATAATINSSFAASWKEKQKWRETQARFNSQDEEDDDNPAAVVAPAPPPPPLKQRRFGLERFGFLSSSTVPRVSDRTPRVVSDDNVSEQARRDRLASCAPTRWCNEDLTPSMDNDDHYDETPAKKARIVSIEKRPFDDKAAMADDLVEEEKEDDTFVLVPSPSASSVSTAKDPTPSRANNLPSIQDIDDGGDKVKTSVLGPPEALGEATSSPSASSVQARKVSEVQTSPVENEIVWSHFGSTEDVKADYRMERRSLSMRKRKLKEMKNAETTEGAPAADAAIRLKKEEFRDMQIIGQYNMGFILAKDAGGNIWILDQHACDEKHKFEKLCAETTIHDQRLMAPLPLELSSLQEACIQDNLAVFEKNGFRFQYDDGQPPGRRCALTALPHSGAQNGRNAVQYGKDDVVALCALLMGEDVDGGTGTDGTGMYGNNAVRRYASSSQHGQVDTIMARLPKTIAMFASRACRSSIMVGTALSRREMEKLVHRLADLEQPWNCPHGRPTLQHVRRLRAVLLDDEKRAAALIAEPTVTVLSQEADDDDVEDGETSK